MTVFTRGLRNAFRNSGRSVGIIAILALSIGLSISMLLAHQAVTTKIASVRSSTGTTVNVSPAGFFGGQGGGTPLKSARLGKVATLPHVTSVSQRLSQRLSTTDISLTSPITPGALGQQVGGPGGGRFGESSSAGMTFTLPIEVTGTNTPGTALTQQSGGSGGSKEKLVTGTTFSATSTAHVAIVGTAMATKNDLKVGSTFTAWSTPIKVIGTYEAGSTFANAGVLMPLATVQELSGSTGDVTGATITVDSIDNVPAVTKATKALLGSTADVTSSLQAAETSLAPLASVKTISLYALFAALAVAGLITLFSMVMVVRERRREIGVLKAIGAKSSSVVSQFMVEATALTMVSAVLGLVVGILAANPITSTLITNQTSTTTAVAGPGGFAGGFPGRPPSGARFDGGSMPTPPSGGFHAPGGGVLHSFGTTISSVQAAAGWTTVMFGLLAAVLLAAGASAFAAWSTSKIRPSEILRSE